MTVLPNLAAELEALRAENAALKLAALSKIKCKVSEKGAVSVYGLGKWPITLYQSQWASLLDAHSIRTIQAFIAANASKLLTKD